jgi:hypothetical protein
MSGIIFERFYSKNDCNFSFFIGCSPVIFESFGASFKYEFFITAAPLPL